MDDLNKKLYEAVEENDVKKEDELIKQGADAKACFNGDPLLHRAAEKGNVESIEFLAHYVDVNAKGCGGETALYVASKNNQKDAAATLRRLDASTETRDDEKKADIQRVAVSKRPFENMVQEIRDADRCNCL